MKNDDKIGDLIFQSPNCPINLRRKIAISVLLMQFMICLPLIIIIIDNYPSIFSIQQIIISIIFFFVALNIPLFMLSDKLFPHFEIYTNGIVKPVIHKQPFFEITANVENFIYWHEIRYFISETTNSGERVVKIFLTSPSTFNYIIIQHPDSTVIQTLIKELIRHNVLRKTKPVSKRIS